jgi:DNA-binding SARP family transcriptional activator
MTSVADGPTALGAEDRVCIGRAFEQAVLRDVLEDAVAGKGGLVLIGGEPGTGKSLLSSWAVATMVSLGGVAGAASCWAGEGAPALWPWRRALGAIARAAGTSSPDVPADVEDLFVVFDTVAAWLGALPRPALIVIDDAHAADAPSMGLAALLGRHVDDLSVAVVLSHRPAALGARTDLVPALHRFEGVGRRLELGPLEPSHLAQLVREVAVGDLSEEVAALIAKASEGNPRYALELAQALPLGGERATHAPGVPPSLESTIAARLAALRPLSRAAVEVVAVAGGLVELPVLVRAVNSTPADVADAVDDAAAADLLRWRRGSSLCELVHGLLQPAVYEQLPVQRRATLHGAVADGIEQRHRSDRAAQLHVLARHRLAAVPFGDAQVAARTAGEAAHVALAAGARDDAVRLFLAGIDALDRAGVEAAVLRRDLRAAADRAGSAPDQVAPAEEPRPLRPSIRALGGFEVVPVGGTGPAAWPSRKARTLLQILVTRRGRPIRRDELCELLWPGEEPSALGNRLSVALSAVRTALAGGSSIGAAAIMADRAGVTLDLESVDVDVEHFLQAAAIGLRRMRADDVERARPELDRAAALDGGALFEGDADAPWRDARREEVRGASIEVARALASVADELGELATAEAHLRRLLSRDPYDPSSHRHLIGLLERQGRLGEARRCREVYVSRMAELGVEP